MANGVHLLTGHQDTNHISAADEAAFHAALLSGQNCIIADTKTLTVAASTGEGTVTVAGGIALFSGRAVRITGATASYTRPSASTTYRRVSVGILYTKAADTTEDAALVCYTSEEYATQSAAASADTGAPSNTSIGDATTTAYMELCDMVVTATAVAAKSYTYSLSGTLPGSIQTAKAAKVKSMAFIKDSVTSGGVIFAAASGSGSIRDFLADKHIALMKFRSSTDSAVCAICVYSPGFTSMQACLPTMLSVNGTVYNGVFEAGTGYTGDYDRIHLRGSGIGTFPPYSALPYDHVIVYAWEN